MVSNVAVLWVVDLEKKPFPKKEYSYWSSGLSALDSAWAFTDELATGETDLWALFSTVASSAVANFSAVATSNGKWVWTGVVLGVMLSVIPLGIGVSHVHHYPILLCRYRGGMPRLGSLETTGSVLGRTVRNISSLCSMVHWKRLTSNSTRLYGR